MPNKIITAVVTEPITLADAKLHLKVEIVDDDALITALITAAREFAEHYTGRSLAPQTLELALDKFPLAGIEITGAPVTSITTVKYIDVNGVEQTLSALLYTLNDYGCAASVEQAFNSPWPDTQTVANAVKVRYVAGYAAIPKTVRSAMLLMIGHLYENRSEGTQFKVEQIPMGIKSLLNTVDTMAV